VVAVDDKSSDHIPPKPLPPQGLFISSTTPVTLKSAFKPWHHCSSFNGFTRLQSHFNQQTTTNEHCKAQQSQASSFGTSTTTFVASTHSPDTSFPIAITDAIGSLKSHGNQVPFYWNLIEPHIK
jgi:hypothetical protein